MKKLVGICISSALFASMSISPSPVGINTPNMTKNRLNVNFFGYYTDDVDLSGLGISYGRRTSDNLITDWTIGYSYASGEYGIDHTIDSYTYNASYVVGKNLSNELYIYGGVLFIYNDYEDTVPYGSSGYDVYTYSTIYGLQAGIQKQFNTSFGIISPWFFTNVITGSSETDSQGSTTTSDIDTTVNTQFGLDIYLNSIKSSLNLMYQIDDEAESISLSYSYKF